MNVTRPKITALGGAPGTMNFGVPAQMGGTGGSMDSGQNASTVGPQPNAQALQHANPRARFNRFMQDGGKFTPGWRRMQSMTGQAPQPGGPPASIPYGNDMVSRILPPGFQSMNGGGFQMPGQMPHPIYSLLPQMGGIRQGMGGFGLRGGG